MKTLSRLLSLLVLITFLFASACGDDDSDNGPEEDPIVGVYVLSTVTLNEDVTYYGVDYMTDDDITDIVKEALYSASPCTDGGKTVIDLRADFEVFYACKSESVDPERFGNWTISTDRTQLTMNLIIQDNPFQLKMVDLVVTETNVSGTVENYPLVEVNSGGFEIKPVSVDVVFLRTTL